MPRPKKCRWISDHPGVSFFKPQGTPLRMLDQIYLGVDELEAMRLADLEGLNQKEAAQQMNVSRATFGRIVAQGRKKVADALVHGNAIRIEGGEVELRPPMPPFGWHRVPYRHGKGPWR
jgi:predicted DNA-binding protein (UPF0251 family)